MHKELPLGEIFHEFRRNRNITLKQITDESVSASQISRFERGETDISLSRFLRVLENMHAVAFAAKPWILAVYQSSETVIQIVFNLVGGAKAGSGIIKVTGPIVGVGLVGVIGVRGALLFDAGTFAVSAAAEAMLTRAAGGIVCVFVLS